MLIIDEVAPIHRELAGLLLGESISHGALTVVPLLREEGSDGEPDWLTLAEAGEAVTITEISEAGQVPLLEVTNSANRAVLLLDGEELVGAKQNRVLNTTVLVAAHARVIVPVSCVEQGRWAYRSPRFASSDVSLFASLRGRKTQRVTESLRRGAGHQADQDEVWEGVAAQAIRFGVASPTDAMHDVYDHHLRRIEEARAAVAARALQVGALVYVAGHWVGLDLLSGSRLFTSTWPRISAGYIAEAIGRRKSKRSDPAAQAILETIQRAPAEEVPAVGLGRELRFAADGLHGAALVADERIAHLMAFPILASR